MIQLQHISKSYGTKRAVDGLTLDVPDGGIFGFLGANGAGKSTTIRMITGIEKPDCGYVIVNGTNLAENPLEAKAQMAYVPDEPGAFAYMSGMRNLFLAMTEKGRQ